MPTSASLVTNLPADFNTFGQGVDTSLQDLLGGTTGQVLSKTSGTNMDFTWVTPTDQTPLTTKGDLFTFSTVDARLGVGTNGQALVADSAATTGLKWATLATGKVLQVVQATYSTATTIASTSFTDTGLSVSITPSSATSKVLIMGVQQCLAERAETTVGIGLQLVRTSTAIWISGSGGYETLSFNTSPENTTALRGLLPIMYLDSPSTTSATTYKTQGRVFTTANSGTSTYQENSSPSVLIAIEVGA
jgi:hypothetical protein